MIQLYQGPALEVRISQVFCSSMCLHDRHTYMKRIFIIWIMFM